MDPNKGIKCHPAFCISLQILIIIIFSYLRGTHCNWLTSFSILYQLAKNGALLSKEVQSWIFLFWCLTTISWHDSIILLTSISSYYCQEHLMQPSMSSSEICFCGRRQHLPSWTVKSNCCCQMCYIDIKILIFLIRMK